MDLTETGGCVNEDAGRSRGMRWEKLRVPEFWSGRRVFRGRIAPAMISSLTLSIPSLTHTLTHTLTHPLIISHVFLVLYFPPCILSVLFDFTFPHLLLQKRKKYLHLSFITNLPLFPEPTVTVFCIPSLLYISPFTLSLFPLQAFNRCLAQSLPPKTI